MFDPVTIAVEIGGIVAVLQGLDWLKGYVNSRPRNGNGGGNGKYTIHREMTTGERPVEYWRETLREIFESVIITHERAEQAALQRLESVLTDIRDEMRRT